MKKSCALKTASLFFLFYFLPFYLCAQENLYNANLSITNLYSANLAIADETDLKSLLKKGPDIIYSNVEVTDDNWLIVEVDTHNVLDVPLENVVRIMKNIENHHNVYIDGLTKTKSVKILDKKDNVTTAVFVYATKVGPVTDESYYTATITALDPVLNSNKKSYGEIHKQIGENETIRKLTAVWYACAAFVDGKEYTYIRFYESSEINQKNRKLFVQMGYRNIHSNSLKQLEKAAKALTELPK
ncbi:MAG: hypothetical protein Ta2F_12480 [Termitinemataceae bacterium]|nr:MAG: hypothetical protein Ta2F_12480 [Termitinemataceae bacterium]